MSERHVIVPVPVFPPPTQQTNGQKVLATGIFFITLGVTAVLIFQPF
jgi:hypothetical protein